MIFIILILFMKVIQDDNKNNNKSKLSMIMQFKDNKIKNNN